jgi:hypothetical protein
MKKVISLFFIVYTITIAAQSPGGVAGNEIWSKVNKVTIMGNTTFQYKDFSSNNKPITVGTGTTLTQSLFNYNYSFSYDDSDYVSYLSKVESLKDATVFIVNLPKKTTDPNTKYSLMNSGWDQTVTVGANAVNEQAFEFSTAFFKRGLLNTDYPTQTTTRPNGRINTVIWHKFNSKKIVNSFGSNGESTITIGKSFTDAINFSGQIPEFILYRKALNDKERLRVESYLAIKYGITLQPEVSYLSSKNEVIWSSDNNANFKNRIIGIGNDSNSSLYQRQSTSIHDENNGLIFTRANVLLTNNYPASTTSNAITDQNFILLGDNGGSESFNASNQINGIAIMSKKWLVQKHGDYAHLLNTSLRFKPESPLYLSSNEVLWLLVDRTAINTTQSNFSGINDYYPATFVNGYYEFKDLKWGDDSVNFNQFTFGRGPRMIATTHFDLACNDTTGNLYLDIYGGQPALNINITAINNSSFTPIQFSSNLHTHQFQLNVGQYSITITDLQGNSFNEIVNFSPTGAMNIDMQDVYNQYLMPETIIDATSFVQNPNDSYTYQLFKNDTLISEESTLNLNSLEVGYYTLVITNKFECSTSHSFYIINEKEVKPIKFKVYPVPSSGKFTVSVDLSEINPITINVYDVAGKLLKTSNFTGLSTYESQYEINTAGVYFIQIQSDEINSTQKIIIN